MISITSAQLDTWLATLIFPMIRILALISSAPIFGNKQFPRQHKIALSMLIAILIAPTLDPIPVVPLGSAEGLLIMVQQIMIGTTMGFIMRLIFTGIEMAGEYTGLQMGLGFASFYDPQNSSYSPVIAQWLGIIASLAFISMNGHLMMLSTLAESFHTLPIGGMITAKNYYNAAAWGATIFSNALHLSLPILAAMLITNIALGILTRAAQQLNIFAVGFPITLTIGFSVVILTLPYLAPIMQTIIQEGLDTSLQLLKQPQGSIPTPSQ